MDMPVARTHPAILDEMAGRFPTRNFVTDAWRRLTYSEFRDEARVLAKGLYALGVRKDDKVAILMGNQVEWILIDFAVTMLGGVLVAMNTWWRQCEIHHGLAITDSKVLVLVDRYISNDYTAALREIGDLSRELPQLEHIIGLGSDLPPGSIRFERLYELGRTVPDSVIEEAGRAVRAEDTAYLLFTSGSTGRSKAVRVIHGHNIENPHGIGERMHLSEHDRVLLITSMFWSFNCTNALFATMSHGASIVLQFKHDIAETLRLIESEKCTAVYTQPNIVLALFQHPDLHTRDLSTWRTGICRPNVNRLLYDIGVREMCTSYGLTECYGHSSTTDGHDPIELRTRNSGRPLPNTELQIIDPETREVLPQGAVGEVRLRGFVTPGYYNDPERTAEAIDSEGWFYTGDLGVFEDDQTFRFAGRIKEMIKTGGINVTPADVEDVLQSHPAVKQAIVVGVPDPERDEIVAAMIVPKDDVTLDVDDLLRYCRHSAAAFKVPRYVEIVRLTDVPLTDTGKIHRRRIQELMSANYQS